MTRNTRLALLSAALTLLASAALAQSAPSDVLTTFAPTSSDMAAQFLDVLLGKSAAGTTTPGSALASGMRIFNLAALGFGVLMFTYVAIIGTLKSAEDGELLGKQWSSMWIPLRFVAGTALLVPLGSGYSTAQHGMITLAKSGSGIASQVWAESAGYLAGGGDRMSEQLNSDVYAKALNTSMQSVFHAESCVSLMTERHGYNAGAIFGSKAIPEADGSYTIAWGYIGEPANSQNWTTTECGTLRTAAYQPVGVRTLTVYDEFGVGSTDVTTNLPSDATVTATKTLINAQATGLQAAAAALRPTAALSVAECGRQNQPVCQTAAQRAADEDVAIAAASAAYTAIVRPALQALYASALNGNKLLQDTVKPGWVMAGTAMFSLARAQTEVQKLEQWTPNVSPPAGDDASPPSAIPGANPAYEAWSASVGSKAKNDVANTAGRGLAQLIGTWLGGDATNKKHMLLQIKNSGDNIMSWMQAIIAVVGIGGLVFGKAIAVGAMAAQVIPGMEILKTVGEGAGIAALILFTCGIVMSLVIPMLPFILWAGSVMGWLIAVLQAIIAAPIWLAAHLHPEGDDLTGKAANGYMILLEVLLRPTMMVLGLVAALSLVDIMLRWVGYAFFATVDSVQSDSWTGVASIVTLVIMYLGLTFTILKTCFSLVHDIPSTVMTWIGGAHAGHDKGAEFGQSAQGQINQGLSRAEAPIAGMAVRSMGKSSGGKGGKGGAPKSGNDTSDGGPS